MEREVALQREKEEAARRAQLERDMEQRRLQREEELRYREGEAGRGRVQWRRRGREWIVSGVGVMPGTQSGMGGRVGWGHGQNL